MSKFIFSVLIVLSAYSLACSGTVECKADNPIVPIFSIIPEFTNPLISLTVIDSGKIDPKYTACNVFGYAHALPLAGEVRFHKKLLLCSDDAKTYTTELSGIEIFKGKFIIDGEISEFERAVNTLVFRNFLKGNCDKEDWYQCLYDHINPDFHHLIDSEFEVTLKFLNPVMVISPDRFTINITAE
jgi:hypothetical protein